MTMTVSDDTIAIDFAGSAPQVLRAINVCMAYTIAYTSFGVKAVLAPRSTEQRRRAAAGHDHGAAGLDPQFHAACRGRRARADRAFPADDGDQRARESASGARGRDASARRCGASTCAGVNRARRQELRATCSSSTAATAPRASATARNVLSWPSNISSHAGGDDRAARAAQGALPAAAHGHRRRRPHSAAATARRCCSKDVAPAPVRCAFSPSARAPEAAAPGIAGGGAGAPGEVLIDGKPVDPKTQHVVAPGSTGRAAHAGRRRLRVSDRTRGRAGEATDRRLRRT